MRRIGTAVALICAVFFSLSLLAATDARDFARDNGFTYEEISRGSVPSAKLTGGGHTFMIFGGLRSLVADGTPTALTNAVEWNGATLMLPDEAVSIIKSVANGESATVLTKPSGSDSSYATYTPPKPKRATTRTKPFVVVIDPGHGGHDNGAPSDGGLREKDVNLEVAKKLGKLLSDQNVKVVYTRTTDVFVELDERAAIANRIKPDLFIAVHTNSDTRSDLRGAMTLYPDDGISARYPGIMARARNASDEVSAATVGAGGDVSRGAWLPAVSAAFEGNRIKSIEAAKAIQLQLSPVTGKFYRDGGVIEDFRGLRVLRQVHSAAVLVEMDFLSNRFSERKLRQSSYRSEIADAISKGVMNYLENSAE